MDFAPDDDSSRRVRLAVVGLALVAAAAVAGAFAADPAESVPEPVAYDDATELGLSAETDDLMAGDATIPRTQVFYSQLQYVVGYNGIGSFVASLSDGRTERQFGYPLVAYVETFDHRNPETTADGLLSATGAGGWTPAGEAYYVVDSDARTPAGRAVVPFRTRAAADSFAAANDGTVADWSAVRDRTFDVDSAATARALAPARWREADDRVAAAVRTADRPVSLVVGEDAPTVRAAVAAAPPNTTVVVPPGTYDETVTIDEPLTLAGRDARIRGDGNGSVVTVRARDVAITGLRIDGVGDRTRDPEAARASRDEDGDAWDTNIQYGYGHGDAGIRAVGAPGLVVDDVAVETNASGLLLREGSHAVVRDLRVDGSGTWRDGFMGITGMESRVTVTDSRFEGGRDGVYLHRADGSIVRNSTFAGNRYGVHLMFTGDALVADNTIRDELFGGVTVMTRPAGNAIVGNDVRRSGAGIQASGTRTYVGYNTLAHNGLGFSTSARGSLYEHNVVVGNELGARATTVVPSSRVVANDFVGNDRHAAAGAGALRIWSDDGRGNHWSNTNVGPGSGGGRAYRPTAPVDAALSRDVAAVTLRESPAAVLIERLRGTVPGARSGSIVDFAPATAPLHPERVEAVVGPSADGRDAARADWRTELASSAEDRDATADNATAGAGGHR